MDGLRTADLQCPKASMSIAPQPLITNFISIVCVSQTRHLDKKVLLKTFLKCHIFLSRISLTNVYRPNRHFLLSMLDRNMEISFYVILGLFFFISKRSKCFKKSWRKGTQTEDLPYLKQLLYQCATITAQTF